MDDDENKERAKKSPMPGFQGNIYQKKLLMLYLQRGLKKYQNFKLGTEIEEAHQFDDLVFIYSKVVSVDHFIMLQAKHKVNAKITYEDIFTDTNGDFGLVKYYNAFKNAQKENLFNNGIIERVIIYTNAKFDLFKKIPEKDSNWQKLKNIKNIILEIEADQDDGLSLCKIKGGKYYRFKSELVLPVLKPLLSVNPIYYIIAQKLIKVLTNDKNYLTTEDKILKHYDYLLTTEVIDKNKNILRKDFIDEVGNNTGRQKLRSALNEVAKHENVELDKIIGNKLKIRKNFGKTGDQQNWPEDVADEDIEEFLKTFVFAIGQPNEVELGKIILSELGDQFVAYDADLIFSSLDTEIQKWMTIGKFGYDKSKNSSQSRFISFQDAKNFIEITKTKLNNILLKGPTTKYDSYFEKYAIEFDGTSFTNSIHDFLSSDVRILNIVSEHIIISSIKLYKELTKINVRKEFIYARLKSLNDNIIDAFKSKTTDHLLVIELDLDKNKKKCDDWMEKISDIIDIIQNGDGKKLIIISKQKDYLEDILSADMIFHEKNDTLTTLENLTEDSQKSFLNTEIKFQESDVKLRDVIISDELKKSVSGEILTRILKGKTIAIGKQIDGLKDIENYYIERKFIRRVQSDKNNLYLLNEINEEDLCSEYQNFNVIEIQERLTEHESDVFEREVKKNKLVNIYMLKKRGVEFVLIKKSNESFNKSDFENVMKSAHNCELNLISAVAGMGKSTLFTSLSRKMKKHNPKLWVIKIDLNSASSILKKMSDQEIRFENVIDFLIDGANHHSKMENTIFEQYLQMRSVVLYFDAFDEICPNYKEVVIKIIKILKEQAKIKKIWISSRPYDSILSDLKKSFESMSSNHYDIEPYTKDNRKTYFKHYWGQSFEINEESFDTFANLLFKLLSESIHDRTHEFLGIALHTMIIGVIFKDTFENFQKSDSSKIDDLRQELMKILNLSTMYEKFVEKKFEIYWVEKNQVDLNKVAMENVRKNERAKCFENWKILALDTLFDGNKLAIFLSEDETKLNIIKEKFKEKGDEQGIINRIVNNKPFFIHRTFAEYFAAVFIFDNITNEDKKSLEITKYFLENMIDQRNFVICQFVDSMFNDENSKRKDNHANLINKLNKEKLYDALRNKWQWIAIWLIENDVSLEYTSDTYNRLNLLHFVYSQQKDMEITNHLIKIMFVKLKTQNRLMHFLKQKNREGNTTSDIAVKYGKYNNVKYLLDEYVKLEIQDSFLTNENKDGENVLHIAADEDCNDEAFTCLLDFIKIHTIKMNTLLSKRDNFGNIPLNVAVEYGQVNKIKSILKESVDLGIYDRIVMNEDEYGENVLHSAAYESCDIEALTYLLNFIKSDKVKMNTLLLKQNHYRNTPFSIAVQYGRVNKIKSILEELVELKIYDRIVINENAWEENLLHLAANNRYDDEAFTFLLNYMKKSDTVKMEEMLSKRDREGLIPLTVAVKEGQVNKIKSILKESVDLGIYDRIVMNETIMDENVLHYAAYRFCTDEAFICLLDFIKSDTVKMNTLLSKRDKEGYTPLDVAKLYDQSSKVESISNVISELNISVVTDTELHETRTQFLRRKENCMERWGGRHNCFLREIIEKEHKKVEKMELVVTAVAAVKTALDSHPNVGGSSQEYQKKKRVVLQCQLI